MLSQDGYQPTHREQFIRLETSIKRKEAQAKIAKQKGMQTTFGNLMDEISQLKVKLKKLQMGS